MDQPAPPYGPSPRRPALSLALSALCLSASACEWVLDGVPSLRGSALDAASSWDGSVVVAPAGDAGDGHVPSGVDGAVPPSDAGPSPQLEAGPAPIDAGPPVTCVAGERVYRDIDGDGFGTGVPIALTCPPAFPYSAETGDCNDSSADVFPGQKGFFGVPYRAPDGSLSFDYDCSGTEEGNGRQAVLGSCGLLGAALCQGKGYAPSDSRFATFGINTACGSTLVQECRAEFVGAASCRASAGTRAEPFVCR